MPSCNGKMVAVIGSAEFRETHILYVDRLKPGKYWVAVNID